MSSRSFWLATRPYNVIDAINRIAAATGSPGYAMRAAHADYNGHAVWLDFRRHAMGGPRWITEYTWAGRVVLARGLGREGFEDCVRAGVENHAQGALGASFRVHLEEGIEGFTVAEQAAICTRLGLVEWSTEAEAAHEASYRDARFGEVHAAMSCERQFGCPAVGFLANSATIEEYRAKVDAFFAERLAARRVGT